MDINLYLINSNESYGLVQLLEITKILASQLKRPKYASIKGLRPILYEKAHKTKNPIPTTLIFKTLIIRYTYKCKHISPLFHSFTSSSFSITRSKYALSFFILCLFLFFYRIILLCCAVMKHIVD